MSSEVKRFTVEELVRSKVLAPPIDGNHGGIHPKVSDYVSAGVPFIMASDLKNGLVDFSECAFISEIQAKKLKKGFAKPGDILISHKATIGRTALLTGNFPTVVLTPQVTYYRVLDSKKINNRYLKYYFDSKDFQDLLATWAGAGSTRAYIGITAQAKLPIVLPPIEVQKNIAEFLGAIDDRINLLRETNTTLEAMAQALFKSWFVDFDPVHAKQQGRAPEGMDAATAALFPDSFEESELGMVPKGWRVAALSKICVISSGKRPVVRADTLGEEAQVPLYGGAGVMGFTSKSLFDSPKILTGRVGTLGKVHIANPPFWASDNVLVISPTDINNLIFLYQWISSIDLIVLNRGSTQPLLTQKDLGAQMGVIPSTEILAAFEEIGSALYERIKNNLSQIDAISSLRDTLLPRLISGQLRLPEAQKLAQAAVAE